MLYCCGIGVVSCYVYGFVLVLFMIMFMHGFLLWESFSGAKFFMCRLIYENYV